MGLFWAIFSLVALQIFAKPSGFRSPHATLQETEKHLTVQSDHKAIIHWDTFSLAPDESIFFQQMSGQSAVLNRVIGGKESQIYGNLHSNGRVFLLNPAGVLIGPSGRIETAGFIASSFDVLDQDFLETNILNFSGDSLSSILNLGQIRCPEGDVALIARRLENRGMISAPKGQIFLESCLELSLTLDDGMRIFIRPKQQLDATEGTAIENTGMLEALSVELESSGNLYTKAIYSEGQIDALSLVEKKGKVYLVADTLCEVNGPIAAKGGIIHVLGREIRLGEATLLDTSSDNGGGTILVGGDYQGKNPDIRNAKRLYVDAKARAKADALVDGDGGKVIFWSDEATYFYGASSARGGEKGGDGGFTEVSGDYLDFKGIADHQAPCGKWGELLLDPINITISTSANSGNVAFAANAYQGTGATPCSPTPALINNADIQTNLGLGNVTISTNATNWAGCGDAGNITWNASSNITWSANTLLTLTANSSVTLNSSITNTNSGANFDCVSITANGNSSGTNSALVLASGTISTNSGNIILSGALNNPTAGSTCNAVYFNGGAISTVSGSISITASSPVVATFPSTFNSFTMNTLNGITSSTGTVTINSTTAADSNSSGCQFLQNCAFGTTGDVTISSLGVSCALFASLFSSQKNISITGTNSSSSGAGVGVVVFGAVQSTNGGNISVQGVGPAVGVRGTGTFSVTTSGAGSIQITGTGVITVGPGNPTYGVQLTSLSSSTLSLSTGSGTISVTGTALAGFSNLLAGLKIETGLNLSTTGSINLTGINTGSNSGAHGIWITSPITVSSVSSGLTLTGTAGSGSNSYPIALGNSITASSSKITFNSPVVLVSSPSLSAGSDIIFSSSPSLNGSSAGGQALTLTAGGTVSFAGAVGSTTPLGALTINAGQIRIGNGILTNNGAIALNGPTILTGSGTISTTASGGAGTNITFASTLNGTSAGGQNLTLTAGTGSISFAQAVGGTTKLGNVTITSSGVLTISNNFTSSSFTSTSTGTVTSSAGTIDTRGASGASGSSGGAVSITSAGSITLGPILTTGGTASGIGGTGGTGGSITIQSTAGTLSVNTLTASGGAATASGGVGGNGGNIQLLQPSTYTTLTSSVAFPTQYIILNGDITTTGGQGLPSSGSLDGAGGTIALGSGFAVPMSIATIQSSLAGNDVTLSGNSITMATNESMTILGNLTIYPYTAYNGGDTIVKNVLTITAPPRFPSRSISINANVRSSVSLLSSTGSFYTSPSTHFAATSGSFPAAGTPSFFQIVNFAANPSLLTFTLGSPTTILDYDTNIPTPSPSSGQTVSASTRTHLIYLNQVAISQMSYYLDSDSLPPIPTPHPTRFFQSWIYEDGKPKELP
jgi:filamentous hemagglutinin family protein